MTAETLGTKGQPHFSSAGAPQIDVDPSLVADYAALVGNHIVGTAAQRNAGVVPGTSTPVWVGLTWEDTTDGLTYKCTALPNTWQKQQAAPFAMEQDRTNVPITSTGGSWSVVVNFTTGVFTQPPVVQATHQFSPGTLRKLNAQVANVSTTQFTLIVSTGDGTNPGVPTGTNAVVGWWAIQMSAASATGAA